MTIEKCKKCNRVFKIDSFINPNSGEKETVISCRCNEDYLSSYIRTKDKKQNKNQNTR